MAGQTFQFNEFKLDCGCFELSRNGLTMRLERKPMELLILLVSRQGQVVTRAEMAERLWSRDVFVDTEHGINTAVRKLRNLLRDDPENPRFIQTVTGMGYRFIAPVTVVEPAALAAAEPPAEEPNAGSGPKPGPDNVSTESAAPEPQTSAKRLPLRQIVPVGRFVALSLAFIVIAVPHKVAGIFHREMNPPITSLAVLPLDNLSGDPTQEYFADGMTDELITMLAKETTLRITSRTSVMQYKGARRPLPEIARALNVDGIVEGSVSRGNGTVHMNLQLIRADKDAHLWANSYDRSANGIAALAGEAAHEIAVDLHSATDAPAAPARNINPDAHDAYLRGQFLWYGGRNLEAIDEFNRAIALQPDYAAAWAGLSNSYAQGAAKSQIDLAVALPKEEMAANKALELDPMLPEAHLAMGAFLIFNRWEWARGDQEVLRAIELNPQFTQAVHFQAMVLAATNRGLEGVAMQKRASEIDPIARPWALPRAFLWARDYDSALNDALAKEKTNPNVDWLDFIIYRIYRARGDEKEAGIYLMKFLKLTRTEKELAGFQSAYEKKGYRGLVAKELDEAEKDPHYVSPFYKATLSGELGDREKALSNLEHAFRIHDVNMYTINCDPEFDFLHGEPRFQAIVKSMGLQPPK